MEIGQLFTIQKEWILTNMQRFSEHTVHLHRDFQLEQNRLALRTTDLQM